MFKHLDLLYTYVVVIYLHNLVEFLFKLILSLEKRLMELNNTLKNVTEKFLEKSFDLEAQQKKSDDQVRRLNQKSQIILLKLATVFF